MAANLKTDVLVIGGGIAGVTAAYLLKKAGKSVILVERGEIGTGETGHTTAHISYPTDIRLKDLVHKFGRDHAQAVWDAGMAATEQIATNAAEADIECELRRVPGFLFAAADADDDEPERLRKDAELAAELGFDAAYVPEVPLAEVPGIRFANLAKFHPQKYLLGLAKRIPGEGSHLFEHSNVSEFKEEPRHVICNGHTIHYQSVFLATHVPLQGVKNTVSAALLQTKLALYSTYVIGARAPRGSLPEALLWDTADPYLYLRIDRQPDCDYVIIGGADHKTGQEAHTESCYASLEDKLQRYTPQARPDRRWSGQVIETLDGLPYIGPYGEHQFIATGFSGTGMTFGTLGAMMFRDYVLGATNPWQDLLSVERKKLSSTWDYLKENKDYPYYLLKDLFKSSSTDPVSSLPPGEGKLLLCDGKKTAVYRDEDGKVTKLSPTCPHMGCTVGWNASERTWDCPCHGSRFTAQGELMGGPAETGLTPMK
ncbi:MAG: hypothetical protein B7Z47_01640 [Chthoniobacter sp. 12-60-6]|nr:MAG: hypothetical protein B7Z47_01640 [Chthoniobacter sp. 12-60-6]